MLIVILIILLLLISLAIYGWFIIDSFRFNRNPQLDSATAIEALGVPKTGAERHQAIKSDPRMLEKIKQAAAMKVRGPSIPWLIALMSRAGISSQKWISFYLLGAAALILLCGIGVAIIFSVYGGGGVSAVLGAFTGVQGGAVLCFMPLFQRATLREQEILRELPFFAEQLIMITVSGQSLESGLRVIDDVCEKRGRRRTISQIMRQVFREREQYDSFEKALSAVLLRAGSRELRQVLNVMLQSERHGTEVVRQLQGLSVQARTTLRKRPVLFNNTKKFYQDFMFFMLYFTQALKTGVDIITSIDRTYELLSPGSPLRIECELLKQLLQAGVPEETALLQFGRDLKFPELDLFVEAIVLSGRSPGRLYSILSEVFSDVRAKSQ